MIILILASMALELLLLLVLVVHSRHHVIRSFPGRNPEAPHEDSWPTYPKATLIVPLTGNSPEMPPALESLLSQPYPDYETILVTRDLDDPAVSLVRELLSRYPRVRHIVSGPATACSQKNHNILAGVRNVSDTAEILVFCDSTHQAPPTFLRELIRPLVTGKAVITSGFHRIIPGDARIATLGMLQTVLTIHLLHGFPAIALPWGGATAILRTAFQNYGVAGVLGTNVLDDFPMGQRLLRFGIRSVPVGTAILNTHLTGQTWRGWEAWLTRQMLYPKYCLPIVWLGAALAAWVLAGPIFFAAGACLGGLFGLVAAPLALVSLGFLLALTALGAWCRTLVPVPVPLVPWLLAFYANIFMACRCYLNTWLTDTIAWRGISYRVTWGGRVKEILREQ
ncbi:MAG: glycosyltransferase [Thermodesulfobacteriota bacterium]